MPLSSRQPTFPTVPSSNRNARFPSRVFTHSSLLTYLGKNFMRRKLDTSLLATTYTQGSQRFLSVKFQTFSRPFPDYLQLFPDPVKSKSLALVTLNPSAHSKLEPSVAQTRCRGVASGEWRCFAGGGLGALSPPAGFGAEPRKFFEG